MITVEIRVMNKDHFRKVANLIANYNKLNDDKIDIIRAYETIVNKEDKKKNLKNDGHQ